MRKNKAVSPVIATLLLILIAVAAAVLVYVWVTGYATSVTSSGTPELRERIKVEAVSYDSTNDRLTIYVRNVGDVSVTIDYVYVIDAETGNVEATTNIRQQINVDQVVQISMTAANLDGTYIVKVVTTNGVEAASTFTV